MRKSEETLVKDFKRYLENKGFRTRTIRNYINTIKRVYLSNPDMKSYNYQNILTGMERYNGGSHSQRDRLVVIKKYYDYLIDTGQRQDHPCQTLYIKGNVKRNVIHSDLFSSSELELLLSHKRFRPMMELKNQVMVSLMIYQGAMPREIVEMKLSHIDMDAGTVYISGGPFNASRRLQMHPNQYIIMERYLNEVRSKLAEKDNDSFLVNYKGESEKSENIKYHIETCEGLFPDRHLTPFTIRDSVISNWLNETKLPLDQVQLMAGHRWISSTERYVQRATQEEREVLRKIHPLG